MRWIKKDVRKSHIRSQWRKGNLLGRTLGSDSATLLSLWAEEGEGLVGFLAKCDEGGGGGVRMEWEDPVELKLLSEDLRVLGLRELLDGGLPLAAFRGILLGGRSFLPGLSSWCADSVLLLHCSPISTPSTPTPIFSFLLDSCTLSSNLTRALVPSSSMLFSSN